MKHNSLTQNSMDLEKIFHMKGGHGDTSYSKNSSLQKKAADQVKPITCKTIEDMFIETKPKSLGIADLGCSSGPNTLSNIKLLVQTIQKASRNINHPVSELRIYLNDLPTNDFNTIFQALPDLYKDLNKDKHKDDPAIYIAGYPGTFYGRLFPDNCLHFVYSSNCLHWLSEVPPGIFDEKGDSINKESVYITDKSPALVSKAYLEQFQKDFSLFLRSRSMELVQGGRMVLISLGRNGSNHIDRGSTFYWETLFKSLAILVTQGEVEEERLDSYDVHFYAPSKKELEDEVRKEGSFQVEQIDMFEIKKDSGNYSSYGMAVAKAVRSIQESMLIHHFGVAILDKLFDQYGKLVDEELAKKDIKSFTVVQVLKKI